MATTFAPNYVLPTGSAVQRGGPYLLDIDIVTSGGAITRDARGGPLLCKGDDRLVNRIVRALLTDQGSWPPDPYYGSSAVPELSLAKSAAVQVSQVVMAEVARYSSTRSLSPGDRVSRVAVTSKSDPSDARNVILDLRIENGAGTIFPARVTY